MEKLMLQKPNDNQVRFDVMMGRIQLYYLAKDEGCDANSLRVVLGGRSYESFVDLLLRAPAELFAQA